MNVLRDTHRALVPGGLLLDFHPTYPPWAQLVVANERIGEIEEPDFPAQLRSAESAMREVVSAGLFAPVEKLRRDIVEYYDDADELIAIWGDCVSPELQERVRRAPRGRVSLVYKLVFDLYRALGSTTSPTRTRPGSTTEP